MNKSLSELAVITYGADYKKNPVGDSTPIIGTGGIMGYTSIALNEGPAVLTGRKGSINKPVFIESKFWNVDTIFCVKALTGVDTKWLYYNFLNTNLELLNEATGVPSVNTKSLYRLKFNYVDLKTQQKIAKILSKIDEVIYDTEALIEKYKAIKAGLLEDLFSRGIDENGKLRPSPHDAPELYKDSVLGLIPKDWEVVDLKDLTERIFVGIATSSSGSYAEKGVLFLRNQNIKENRIDIEDVLYIKKEFADANSSKYLEENDVVSVRTGYPGQSAVVTKEFVGSQTFTTLITRPNKRFLNSYFLSYFMNSGFGRKQVLSLQGGGAQQNLNSGELETLQIFKIRLFEQARIVEKFQNLELNLLSEEAYLTKLQGIRWGLMEDLLSGRVLV